MILGRPRKPGKEQSGSAVAPSSVYTRVRAVRSAPWGRISSARSPLLVFWIIYGATCLFGGIVMLAGLRNFNRLYQYFSGTPVAHLTNSQGLIDVVLLVGAPAALWLGYEAGLVIRAPAQGRRLASRARGALGDGRADTPAWFPILVFYGLAAIAVVSIAHAGSLHNISSWLDYNSWIAAREQAFSRMRFFEFVNIYLLVPVAAAWVLITSRSAGRWRWLTRWLPMLLTLGIDFLLFQKKTAIVSLFIIMFAWILAVGPGPRRQVRRAAALTALVALAVYIAAVVVPVYSKASTASICSIHGISCRGSVGVPSLLAYTLLSPLTRSSAPALYYPIIFPHHHGFYPLQSIFALDILGIGTFPNDNQVVWHFMNPHISGTTMVPFQFTLYSQGGLAVALFGSLIMGLLLAFAWRFARSKTLPRTWSALVGSMVLLLAVYLALDSLRNSTLVSYGAVWGVLFIALALSTAWFANGSATRTLMRPSDAWRRLVRLAASRTAGS